MSLGVYSYLKFFFKAKTKYGIHSPFVYDFIESVLEDNRTFYSYIPIEYFRNQLYSNKQVIKVNDLGAGSKKIKENNRTVAQIAKNSLQNRRTAQLLFRIVDKYQCNNIIEIGTSLGVTTAYLSKANKEGRVYSIEGCSSTLQIAKNLSNKLKIKNVTFINGNFNKELPKLIDQIESVDFVYFDGNHTKAATLNYFNLCKNKIDENTVFVFDDINWSKDMQEAWEEIKKDKIITVTIDLYHIGLVFFHPVKIKNDFKLRNTLFFN